MVLSVFLSRAFTHLGHECHAGMPIFCYFPVFFRYFWPDPFSGDSFSVFSIFSYFIFLFLNFLSRFVFIFCETAHTRRFSVIFTKVQWHPWSWSFESVRWSACVHRLDLGLCSHLKDRPAYLSILVQKWAGSTDVRLYFSKYGHRVSGKYRNGDMNKCEFFASEADLER